MLQNIDKVQDVDSSEAVDEGLLKILASMPASLKVEILHYAEYLLQKNAVETATITNGDQLDTKVRRLVYAYPETISNGDQLALEVSETEPPKKKSLAGCMKGTFILPLPDNFNDPLEEFAEYM